MFSSTDTLQLSLFQLKDGHEIILYKLPVLGQSKAGHNVSMQTSLGLESKERIAAPMSQCYPNNPSTLNVS